MKRGGLKSLIIGVFVALLCISSLGGALMLLFTWEDIRLDVTMPRYPGMRELTYAQGYYGADTGSKTLYFWTEHPIEEVQQFYEAFALPFVERGWLSKVTVFNPYGGQIPLAARVAGPRFDTSADRECHYTQAYNCIKI
jgi:hypothetical protein